MRQGGKVSVDGDMAKERQWWNWFLMDGLCYEGPLRSLGELAAEEWG